VSPAGLCVGAYVVARVKGGDQVSGQRRCPPSLRVRRLALACCRLQQGAAVFGSRCAVRAVKAWQRDGPSGRAPLVPMMETADLRDSNDGAVTRRHDRTRNRRVFVQRQVRAGPFEVRTIEGHQPFQARFVEHDHVIEALTTGGTHNRSTNGFCQGAWGAVSTSSIPIAFAVASRPSNAWSRSWIRYRGASSYGNASRSCWAVHAAVGCAVTATCRMRRRSWARSTRTNKRR
jgi:hypothetical protein